MGRGQSVSPFSPGGSEWKINGSCMVEGGVEDKIFHQWERGGVK